MANGAIGQDMAQREIDAMIGETQARMDAPPLESHCPDHALGVRVQYALLLGMSSILRQNARTVSVATVVSAVVTGVSFAVLRFFTYP